MLNFLKELPAIYLVFLMLVIFIALYVATRDRDLLTIIVGLVGSFTTLCMPRRNPAGVSAPIENADITVKTQTDSEKEN